LNFIFFLHTADPAVNTDNPVFYHDQRPIPGCTLLPALLAQLPASMQYALNLLLQRSFPPHFAQQQAIQCLNFILAYFRK